MRRLTCYLLVPCLAGHFCCCSSGSVHVVVLLPRHSNPTPS